MDEQALKYVFRGTTFGFRGNATSNRIPSTSTSMNPAKALAFALCGEYEYGREGIVFIADVNTIQAFERHDGNCFENVEEEIGFSVSPGEFQDRCLGYVLAAGLKALLQQENIMVGARFGLSDLSRTIHEIEEMSAEKIDKIFKALEGQIKKM